MATSAKYRRYNGTTWEDIIFPYSHEHEWSDIKNTPTTLAGYGITDAITNLSVDGTAITFTKSDGSTSTFNTQDVAVSQELTTTNKWRKVLLSAQASTNTGAAITSQTGATYAVPNIEVQPNTGSLRATTFYEGGTSLSEKYLGINGTALLANGLTGGAKGSGVQPVYFNASGVPVACTYELRKSVPSDAKFTDTTYTFKGGENSFTVSKGESISGTAINPTGTYDKFYFNTSMSNEDVINILSQLDYFLSNEDWGYTSLIFVSSDYSKNIFAFKNNVSGTPIYYINYQNGENIIPIFNGNSDSVDYGWFDIDNPLLLGGVTGISDIQGNQIGQQNELLKDLISSTSFGDSQVVTVTPVIPVVNEATDGLMGKDDKAKLNAMWDVWSADDGDTLVNKVQEVLKAFENFPEADNLVTLLNDKQDKNASLTAISTLGGEVNTKGFLVKIGTSSWKIDSTVYVSKTDFDTTIGNINSLLDTINGEVI